MASNRFDKTNHLGVGSGFVNAQKLKFSLRYVFT